MTGLIGPGRLLPISVEGLTVRGVHTRRIEKGPYTIVSVVYVRVRVSQDGTQDRGGEQTVEGNTSTRTRIGPVGRESPETRQGSGPVDRVQRLSPETGRTGVHLDSFHPLITTLR